MSMSIPILTNSPETVYRQTLVSYPVREGDPNNTSNALMQVDAFTAYATSSGQMTQDDALKLFVTMLAMDAEKKGKQYKELYANYPAELKKKLYYTPEDLDLNQNVTVAGIKLQLGASAGYLLGLAVSTIATIALRSKLPGWARFPPMLIAIYGVTGFMATFSQTVGTIVNNWNDVMHWGPMILQGQLQDLQKQNKTTTGTFTGTGQQGGGFAATATQTKTAKPKMFLGVVYAGRFADLPDFVRHVDDKIVSDEDLRVDVQINLTRWLASIADRLNYEIQVKFEPFDENNVRKPGTWLTMSLYYSGKGGKRIFIDEILLGPFDPVVYYPTAQISESIRDVASKALQPDMFAPTFSGDGRLEVITREGERINIFPTQGTPSVASVTQNRAPSVPPVSRMDAALTLDQNIERGIIREGDFVPGFGVLTPLGTFDTKTWGVGSAPGVAAPSVAVVSPTEQQLLNRSNPTAFTVAYPTDGMFRAVGSLGDSVWRRVGNRVYQASMLVPELIGSLSAYQSAGAQMQAATAALRTKYGIDWYALPTINIGDLASDQTLERTGRAGPDGGFDPFIRGATLQELVEVFGPQVNASTRSATLNG